MAKSLVLDAEALGVFATRRASPKAMGRARAVATVALEEGAILLVSAAVVAETARGAAREAAVMNVLRREEIEVVPVSLTIARRAGRLLHACDLSSAHAGDAFVVATAIECGSSMIATSDPKDIARLLGRAPIRVWAL